MQGNGKINVKFSREKSATGSDFKVFYPAILRFEFVVWTPLQVDTNKNWQFVSI